MEKLLLTVEDLQQFQIALFQHLQQVPPSPTYYKTGETAANSISYLEILVYQALEQQYLPPDQQVFDFIVIEIDNEKERLLKSLNNEKDLEGYVQTRQRQLVRLIDLMSVYCTKNDVYMNIYKSLGELLNLLERDFARYLDEHCKVPFPYLLIMQELIMQDIETVESTLAVNGIDAELFELALRPFYQLLSIEDNDFFYSYHEIVYLQQLYLQLKTFVATDEELQDLLLNNNFNDPEYFRYLTGKIRSQIDEMPTINIKKDAVLVLLRDISQEPANPGLYFKKLHKSLNEQLLSWLSEELSYLKECEISVHQPGELDFWKDYKVLTNLTVAQLGRFIGLLLEEGVILNSNKTELALFFSFFFTSGKHDYIAAGSIRKCFYDKSLPLAESLRTLFRKLITLS
jgi:hypothetical protein